MDKAGLLQLPGRPEEQAWLRERLEALTVREGIALEAAIRQAVDIPEIHEADVVITSARQYDLLTAAAQELQRVVDGLQSDLPSDLVAEDLRMVLDTLGDATGVERITPQATLNNIFSSFCIGK